MCIRDRDGPFLEAVDVELIAGAAERAARRRNDMALVISLLFRLSLLAGAGGYVILVRKAPELGRGRGRRSHFASSGSGSKPGVLGEMVSADFRRQCVMTS